MVSVTTFAQQPGDSSRKITSGIYSNPKLQQYRKSANDYLATFKNRYALDELKKMDAAADTLAVIELKKAENELKQQQESETKEQVAKINEQNAFEKTLAEENSVLRKERNSLWRKASISIVIWLALVALFVIYRLQMYARTNKILTESEHALNDCEKHHEKGEKLFKKAHTDKDILNQAVSITDKLSVELKKPDHAALTSKGEWELLSENVRRLQDENYLLLLLDKTQAAAQPAPGTLDLNKLCDEIIMLADNGIETEYGVYRSAILKDLEKKLPPVKADEFGLARALILLMSNALYACYRHSKTEVKGYQPKITVSTRVLPRFVQLKVKDNGSGVRDEIMENIYEPFFTTETGKRAGLGLSICKNIIEENKGELKIESSLDRGTDVTIKLFL